MSLFFNSKSFDVDAFVSSWSDAPQFLGRKKQDVSIIQWLDAVQTGCTSRRAAERYWPTIARKLLGPKALDRLEEYERVLNAMTGSGEAYKWDWKKFRVAMESMGWQTSENEKKWYTVAAQSPNNWWVVGKKNEYRVDLPLQEKVNDTPPATLHKKPRSFGHEMELNSSSTKKVSRSNTVSSKSARSIKAASTARKAPCRSVSEGWTSVFKPSAQEAEEEIKPVATVVAEAPLWLVNASSALEFLTSEYPKSMTTISALLITAGSIPMIAASGGAALPALAPVVHALGGIGGGSLVAALASSTAQAVGAIAIGLGNWLNMQNPQSKMQPLAAVIEPVVPKRSKSRIGGRMHSGPMIEWS